MAQNDRVHDELQRKIADAVGELDDAFSHPRFVEFLCVKALTTCGESGMHEAELERIRQWTHSVLISLILLNGVFGGDFSIACPDDVASPMFKLVSAGKPSTAATPPCPPSTEPDLPIDADTPREADTPKWRLGRRIREARLARGLTQQRVGQMAGSSACAVSFVELGCAGVGNGKIRAIAAAVGITDHGLPDEPPPPNIPDFDRDTMAARIRDALNNCRKSRQQIADMTGLSRGSVVNSEHGRATHETMFQIATALGLSVDAPVESEPTADIAAPPTSPVVAVPAIVQPPPPTAQRTAASIPRPLDVPDGSTIHAIRCSKGLNQSQLGDAVGVKQSMVSKYERYSIGISEDAVRRMVAYMATIQNVVIPERENLNPEGDCLTPRPTDPSEAQILAAAERIRRERPVEEDDDGKDRNGENEEDDDAPGIRGGKGQSVWAMRNISRKEWEERVAIEGRRRD